MLGTCILEVIVSTSDVINTWFCDLGFRFPYGFTTEDYIKADSSSWVGLEPR